MSYQIDWKSIWALVLNDSFWFLSSSLDSLIKTLVKDEFQYLSQEFDNNVLDSAKQKRFNPYEYMNDFEKFKEQLPSKEKFYSLLTGKKLVIQNMNMFLKFGTNLKWKR